MPAARDQPGTREPSGHPRSLLSLQQVPLQHQGRKARHAPPPLDGTETPRSRFSKCRKEEKRQKEYGGGALILDRRPSCSKQGAGPSLSPQGSSLPGSAGPRLWNEGENEG